MKLIRLKRELPILTILLFFSTIIFPQDTEKLHSVFFFGNLTDVDNSEDFAQLLKNQFSVIQRPFTLVVNGDLVNEKIGSSGEEKGLKKIYDLADMMEQFPNGKLILVPGDRDWNKGGKGGEKSVNNLESSIKKYLKSKNYNQTKWAVKDGCPGPKIYEVNEGLIIIALNSQWWNHTSDKPRPSDGLCDAVTPTNLKEELEDAVEENLDKNILIVGHHPIYSLGNYGGYFSLADQFKPFPVLGSFRTAFHANVGDKKDLANPKLNEFREGMINLLFFHNNIIFASSHEKNQQIIRGGDNFLLNSGAPSKAKYAAKDGNTLLSKKAIGIMVVDYFDNGRVASSFLELDKQNHTFVNNETHILFHSYCDEEGAYDKDNLINGAYVPCVEKPDASQRMSGSYEGLNTILAGKEYKANAWKKMWLGKHYRTTWTTPVQVPYLDLDNTQGGLNIYKKGGGRQTTSLKFKSGNGTEYTFRSVNKDPSKALDYKLRPTFVSSLLRDQTSAQQPYGAMAVAPLLDKIDILHASPTLYLLPNDAKLGPFREKYGNLFGMLEENPGKPNNDGKLFGDADKIVRSTKLFRDFYQHQKRKVDQSEFVRARLFDILVGDWSKHEDNWKWAAYKQDDGWRIYRPIPRDRDHVFSRQDGFLPWLADRRFGVAAIENFGTDVKDIQSLTWQARHMDRFIATEVTEEMFLKEAKFIQENISASDIENAILQMPAEVYEKSGREIENKLKSRIKNLDKSALKYYALLAKEVEVLGSLEKEYFEIHYQDAGQVDIKMYDNKEGSKGNDLLYHRTFLPGETKEIRLYGLGGADIFDIQGSPKKTEIKVRTFGGPGDDLFKDNAASAKTLIYDKGKGTTYELNGAAKVVNHWNKKLYDYNFDRFEYNYSLPLVYLGYNRFTGFGVNLGGLFTIRKFGKDDYQSKHSINAGYTTNNNLTAAYKGRFHQVFKNWDLQLKASFADADFYNYFYGLGNSSVKVDSLFDNDFYEARVNTVDFSIGLVKDFWQESIFDFHIGIERSESEQLDNTFLDAESSTIFGANEKLTILPVETRLDLDFRDSKGLPYRGTRAFIKYQNGTILSGDNENYGVAKGSIEYYISTRTKNPLTLGFRGGGAISHGDVPWYKLPTLGDRNGLRGYFENRFAGESSAYVNVELRYQLFEKYTPFVPVKVGIKAFYDRGRVYTENTDESNSWRYGYGFGFYMVPLSEGLTISLSASFSDEENVYPVFSIGTPLR